jgi:transcriptional regulator with AAA-type ATPase domain
MTYRWQEVRLTPAQQAARLVGQNSTFLAALDRIKRVAPTDATVLISGASDRQQ